MSPPLAAQRSRAGGFCLPELLVGVVVAVLGLGGALMATVAAARLRRADQELTLAFHACRKRIEELRDVPYASLVAQHGTGFAVDLDGDGHPDLRPVPSDADGLPGAVTVTVHEVSGQNTIYRVEVTVRWEGMQGVRLTSLASLIGNRRGT
jgi:hypothetical protein